MGRRSGWLGQPLRYNAAEMKYGMGVGALWLRPRASSSRNIFWNLASLLAGMQTRALNGFLMLTRELAYTRKAKDEDGMSSHFLLIFFSCGKRLCIQGLIASRTLRVALRRFWAGYKGRSSLYSNVKIRLNIFLPCYRMRYLELRGSK